ncbi:SSU ribosomal protein S4P [Coriobacterium glomerans PW2]|uniref:Small ribosomal subunit protein uS4 n=1 Tax=Coriobacterium glomerans (strain ATCC 49209 / DSM 20642 / JCM 10262 / PW2) TaxID=700015 RepID=F2N8M1_CORGP|nr:30S ribosomal protein S4 [Coriobacterium glomerans]AEB07404.1 SSU ribosomal protein S4P [Coriobacterium glomerans PW2]
MAIDRTPVLKRCRQLGIDPVELGYSSKKESIRQPKRRRKESEYGTQLREKQKAKFIYGVLEKQFRRYYFRALKMTGITGENLMTLLETRLDNVVFRLGFARTRKEARQTVRHGHFTVNGHRVDIPSYLVKEGDVIAVGAKFRDLLPIKEALISSERFEVPGWLEVDIEKLSGSVLSLPSREQISTDIKEQLIIEHYSK